MIGAAEVSRLSPLLNEIQAQQGKRLESTTSVTNHFYKTEFYKAVSRKEAVTLTGCITLCTAPSGEAQGLSHLVPDINYS